jgi:hypothetical protein
MSAPRVDVGCWHEPAEPECPLFGRYRGQTGHDADSSIRSTLTHSRVRQFAGKE